MWELVCGFQIGEAYSSFGRTPSRAGANVPLLYLITLSNLSPTTPTHTTIIHILTILVGLGQRFIQQRWIGNPKLARTILFI